MEEKYRALLGFVLLGVLSALALAASLFVTPKRQDIHFVRVDVTLSFDGGRRLAPLALDQTVKLSSPRAVRYAASIRGPWGNTVSDASMVEVWLGVQRGFEYSPAEIENMAKLGGPSDDPMDGVPTYVIRGKEKRPCTPPSSGPPLPEGAVREPRMFLCETTIWLNANTGEMLEVGQVGEDVGPLPQ